MQLRTMKMFSFQFLKLVPLITGTEFKLENTIAKLAKEITSKPYKFIHIIPRNLIIQIMAHPIPRYLVQH